MCVRVGDGVGAGRCKILAAKKCAELPSKNDNDYNKAIKQIIQ